MLDAVTPGTGVRFVKGHGTAERLRPAARPRRHARPDRRGASPAVRPPLRASAPTACCASCRARSSPTARRTPTRPGSSWTTATPTARSPRCAATASASTPATSSREGLARPGALPRRHPRRGQGARRRRRATARSPSTWASAEPGDDARHRRGQGHRSSPWATRTPWSRSTRVAALGVLDPARKDLNVEYVEERSPTSLVMRVHERGVGETQSCGTGACAVVVAHSLWKGTERGTPYDVEVPGGHLVVTWREDGRVLLHGPGGARRLRHARPRRPGGLMTEPDPRPGRRGAQPAGQRARPAVHARRGDPRRGRKAEHGLRGRPMYHLGRGGALGDVPAEVVIAAEAFFPPDVVRKAWDEGRAAARAARRPPLFYAGCCADWGRAHLADLPDARAHRRAGRAGRRRRRARRAAAVRRLAAACPAPTTRPAGSPCCCTCCASTAAPSTSRPSRPSAWTRSPPSCAGALRPRQRPLLRVARALPGPRRRTAPRWDAAEDLTVRGRRPAVRRAVRRRSAPSSSSWSPRHAPPHLADPRHAGCNLGVDIPRRTRPGQPPARCRAVLEEFHEPSPSSRQGAGGARRRRADHRPRPGARRHRRRHRRRCRPRRRSARAGMVLTTKTRR